MSPPVFVLGMHRSGTSALAGALTRLGYSLGSKLVGAEPGVNDRGFFEDTGVLALHEALFESWGRDWRLPLPAPDGWMDQAAQDGFRDRVAELAKGFARKPRWAIKDPRLCLTFPLWRSVLEDMGIRPTVIVSLRSPSAVATSLLARDELGIPIGTLLWVHHMLGAERSTRGLQRIAISYDDLIDRARSTILNASAAIDLQVDEEALRAAMSFLTPALRHEVDDPTIVDEECSRIWQLFSSPDLENPTWQEELDRLSDHYARSIHLLGPALASQGERISMWEGEFAESDRQLLSVGSVLSKQESGFANAMRQLEEARSSNEMFLEALEKQEAGFQQAVEFVKQRDQEIAGLKLERERLRAELASQQMRQTVSAELEPVSSPVVEEATTYQGKIDLRVDNNSHTRVARYIEQAGSPDKGPILDIGCSSGYFGEALREQGFEVWGVEPNPRAASEATQRLDQVYSGTIEDFLTDASVSREARFQFIIFGDVLEHVVDPVKTLQSCQAMLVEGGQVIASLPNVAHKAVRLMLLEGRWDYDETGILDRTHLHFFTRDSLVRLFDEAGYRIRRLSAITLDVDNTGVAVSPKLEQLFEQHINDREQDVFQFVVLAEPDEDCHERATSNRRYLLRNYHRILCVPPLKDSSLCSIRLVDPLTRLNEKYGGEFRVQEPHLLNADDIEWADTIIFQRESNALLLDMMRRLRAAGKRVIFDIDDLLTDVPQYLSVAEHCEEIKPYLESALREVDAVSVSTSQLRHALLQYNPRVYVTPNYARTNHQPIQHYDSDEPIRIIIASSDSVRVDFILGPLKQIVNRPDVAVELIGIGPPGEYLKECGLPIDCAPLMNHEHFKSFLVEKDNTIGLIPLDDNAFNRCKSAIKFFDYALAGIPSICSAVAPYHSVIDDPDNGILCLDNEEAWTTAITFLVTNVAARDQISRRAYERCLRHHNLDITAAGWEELLRDVPFPYGDPVYGYVGLYDRSARQLVVGTLRHMMRARSYVSACRALRQEGVRGLLARWKMVF